ncbi:MAG: hypothetical protein U0521_11325 [Anaerolineae bacterium]
MLDQLLSAVRGVEIVWQRIRATSPIIGQKSVGSGAEYSLQSRRVGDRR